MVTNDNTYAQFHGLEQLTKTGLVAYVFLLFAVGTVAVTGTETLLRALAGLSVCAYILIGVVIRDLLYLLVKGVNRIGWLGRLHLWLDEKIFGFSTRSNRIIFREFVVLLEPGERQRFDSLPDDRKNAIAEAIIASLAEDQSIFESLMQRGIFRSWIWYWIAIYGVLVFGLLTVVALAKMIMVPTMYTHALFTSIGVVAGIHLIVCVMFGVNVIHVTRHITRELGRYFQSEIVTLLRRQVTTA